MSSIIVLDSSSSDDSECDTTNGLKSRFRSSANTPGQTKPPTNVRNNLKRSYTDASPTIKRLKPTQISKLVDKASWYSRESPATPPTTPVANNETIEIFDSQPIDNVLNSPSTSSGNSEKKDDENHSSSSPSGCENETEKTPIDPDYENLIQACRNADPSDDMNKLINTRLITYYQSVHPDFIKSKNFRKTVKSVTEEIKREPKYVYAIVKTVVDELKVRKKSKAIVMSNEDVTTTGNKKRDDQIKKLNKALFVLTRRITKLEEEEVDLNDDNSSYLQVERYKKRACEIYEKICDLTGESKNAHRSVKKPISFNGTCYPQFNRTVQAFVNRTNTFPDFADVLSCLEYCNRQYAFGMKTDEMKKIAQDAFIKIGKLLQNRRKTDLYETVAHFTSNSTDPAEADSSLYAKLSENIKYHSKISTIIDKYAHEQEIAAANAKKAKLIAASAASDAIEDGEEDEADDDAENTQVNESEHILLEKTEIANTNNNNKDVKTVNDKLPQVECIKANGIINSVNQKSLKILSVASLNNNPPLSTNCIPKDLKSLIQNEDSEGTVAYHSKVDEIVISDEEDLS